VWIKLPNQKPTIENLINKRIYAALNKEGIKIPYPQRTLHFEK
jgi:small-conductance mechanosensitive channel